MKSGTTCSWTTVAIVLTCAMVCVEHAPAQLTTLGSSATPLVGVFGTNPYSDDSKNLVVLNTSFKNNVCAGFFGTDPLTGKPKGTFFSALLAPRASVSYNYAADLVPKMNLGPTGSTSINVFSYPVRYGPLFEDQVLGGTSSSLPSPSCADPSDISLGSLAKLGNSGRSTLRGDNLLVWEALSPFSGMSSTGKTVVPRTKVDPSDMSSWGSSDRGGGETALATFVFLAGSFEFYRRRRRS